jgi:hypothetical protein
MFFLFTARDYLLLNNSPREGVFIAINWGKYLLFRKAKHKIKSNGGSQTFHRHFVFCEDVGLRHLDM